MHPSLYDLYFQLEDIHWWFLGMRKIRLAMLRGLLPDRPRTLELACGPGGFLRDLQNAGHDVCGCDFSPKALAYCRRRGLERLVGADINSLPFGDALFDFVACNDAISHKSVNSDLGVLREMHRVCKPGGVILLTDVACPSMFGRHDEIFDGAKRYRLSELRDKTRAAGFQIIRANYANSLLFPIVFLVKKWKNASKSAPAVDIAPTGRVANSLLKSVLFLEASLIRRVRFPFGVEIMITARKPG
jgi:SAM-dependent methyltransferase